MGCVSSSLLNADDDFTQIGTTSLGHHIVSLTSTTYGLLSLDPPPPANHQSPTTPPPRFTLPSLRLESPEVINSWELMAGLDPTPHSSRFNKENSNPNLTPRSVDKSSLCKPLMPRSVDKLGVYEPLNASCLSKHALDGFENFENSNPNLVASSVDQSSVYKLSKASCLVNYALDGYEKLCPPKGENRVVIYTTTLRGIRKTFEACNAVRVAFEGLGVPVSERDVSMDKGFKEELRELMKGKDSGELVLPRVFVRGRYVGGAEEVMRVLEDGCLGEFLKGLPKLKVGAVCEGCGGARFLPCFTCNGSCKMVTVVKEEMREKNGRTVVVRCPDCNENGLVLCPLCS